MKRAIPTLPYHLQEEGFIYVDPRDDLLNRLCWCTGTDAYGVGWAKTGKVEAYCLNDDVALYEKPSVLYYRLRHIDGDYEDFEPGATLEKVEEYTQLKQESYQKSKTLRSGEFMFSRFAIDRQKLWPRVFNHYLAQNNGECVFHVSTCKNMFGGEMNVDGGYVYKSVCQSLFRNIHGRRTRPGDVVLLNVSSSVGHGIGTRGVLFKAGILGEEYVPEIHHNERKTKTSIMQYHRDRFCRYHLTEEETERDRGGCVWKCAIYADLEAYNGISCEHEDIPEYVRTACMKHAISKSSVEGTRSDAVSLIQLMRAFEDRREITRNITREDLDSDIRQSDYVVAKGW